MSEHDDIKNRIEADQKWLESRIGDEPAPDVDLIKMRVGIELGEQWLTQQVRDEVPADLADRVKRRVWAEVQGTRVEEYEAAGGRRKGGSTGRFVRWAVGVAGVAAACVFAFVGWPQDRQQRELFSYATAFEGFSEYDDGLAVELAMLQEDIVDFEYDSTRPNLSDWDDDTIDDLRDQIDRLDSEPGFETSWSTQDRGQQFG